MPVLIPARVGLFGHQRSGSQPEWVAGNAMESVADVRFAVRTVFSSGWDNTAPSRGAERVEHGIVLERMNGS